MENQVILVVDADPKNLQILRDSLESSGFSVITAADGYDAWEKINSEEPDLILTEVNLPKLDGFQLLEKLKEGPTTSSIPIMFLTNRREIQDRVRSLRGGVKDYMIKPLHVKEVIARIRMILRRIERVKSDDTESSKKLVGRLEEFSVVELIESFGVERKSGILSVYNENNRNGEIYFRNGAVVHAAIGSLKAEKAVYQMLPWKQGHFIMTFRDVQVSDTIAVSNLGLLLQGFKRMEEREQLFKLLPSPETTFVISDTFRKIISRKELSTDVAKFITLIDGRRDIMEIIDESTYDDLKTLDKLVKLYQQGFIKPGKATKQDAAEIKVAGMIAQDKNGLRDQKDERTPKLDASSDSNGSVMHIDLPAANPERMDADYDIKDFDLEALTDDHPELQTTEEKAPEITERHFKNAADRKPARDTQEGVTDGESETSDTAADGIGEGLDEEISELAEIESDMQALESSRQDESLDKNDNVAIEAENMAAPVTNFVDTSQKSSNGGHRDIAFADIPEPLSISSFIPDTALLNALTRFRENQEVFGRKTEVNGNPSINTNLGKAAGASTAHKEAQSQPATGDSQQRTETQKISYSFPLRSYGRPRHDRPESEQPDEVERKREEAAAASPGWGPKDEKSGAPRPSQEQPRKNFRFDMGAVEPHRETQKSLRQTDEKSVAAAPFQKHQGAVFPDLEHLIPMESETAPTGHPKPQLDPAVSGELGLLLDRLTDIASAPPAKLVIIGAKISYIEEFTSFLIDHAPMKKIQSKTFEYLGIGERQSANQKNMMVIGVSMEQQFTHLLDSLADGFTSYVLLFEASAKENLDYISYLHSALKDNYQRPFAIAVVKKPGHRGLALDTIRDLISAAQDDLIMAIDTEDQTSILQFMRAMLSDENLVRWLDKKNSS